MYCTTKVRRRSPRRPIRLWPAGCVKGQSYMQPTRVLDIAPSHFGARPCCGFGGHDGTGHVPNGVQVMYKVSTFLTCYSCCKLERLPQHKEAFFSPRPVLEGMPFSSLMDRAQRGLTRACALSETSPESTRAQLSAAECGSPSSTAAQHLNQGTSVGVVGIRLRTINDPLAADTIRCRSSMIELFTRRWRGER